MLTPHDVDYRVRIDKVEYQYELNPSQKLGFYAYAAAWKMTSEGLGLTKLEAILIENKPSQKKSQLESFTLAPERA